MPKRDNAWEHEVFLASPSDVGKYRDIVVEVCSELSEHFGYSDKRRFSLVRFEDVRAQYGASDAQGVINQQIGDAYDVIILIFWCRLGSPTPRAESGTVEEFSRALQRMKNEGAPEIQIYFCNDLISPGKVDHEQFYRMGRFKASLNEGLYREFSGETEFRGLIKKSLRDYMLDQINKRPDYRDGSEASFPWFDKN